MISPMIYGEAEMPLYRAMGRSVVDSPCRRRNIYARNACSPSCRGAARPMCRSP